MKTTITSVKKVFTFEDENGFEIDVQSFNDGLVEIVIPINIWNEGSVIHLEVINEKAYVSFIAGCFAKDSNFKEELFKAYECASDTKFLGFKLVVADTFCIITREKSSLFDIEDSINKFILKFAVRKIEEENRETAIFNSKIEKLDELVENADIEFKNDQAAEEYLERAEGRDEESIVYGEKFIALVQYFMGQGDSILDAVNKTYKMLDDVEEIIEYDIEAIQFICQYCRYGEEIYNVYTDMQMQGFSDELTDF